MNETIESPEIHTWGTTDYWPRYKDKSVKKQG